MKLFVIYFITLLVWGTNCFSQMRISTNDNNYVGFIIDENQSQLSFTTLKKQQVIIEKSQIIKQQYIFVILKTTKLRLKGNILSISDSELELKKLDSTIVIIKISTIEYGQSEDFEVEQFIENLVVDNVNSGDVSFVQTGNKYRRLGVTFGIPSFSSINFGSSNNATAAGIGLGYSGIQIHFGVNLSNTESVEMNFMLNLNYSSYEIYDDFSYSNKKEYEFQLFVGPLMEIYFYGFHAQCGFGFGPAKNDSFKPVIQVGFAYRWRK